jgi:putative DNA primase/helicase
VVEPWPEPVEGDALLRDIIARVRRHVVCSHDDALIIALWIMFAWVHEDVATHSPILNVNSAEPESGKSTTLGLIALLLPRCIASVEITEAALYRAIKLWEPSFAIDEFDSVLANADDKTGLRSAINSGHTRGQGVVRCVGEEKTPELFPTFCPKAIGMCGRKMPAATLSRCIFVELKRKKGDEEVERFEHKDDPGLADLRSRLFRWSMDSAEPLRAATPAMPEGLKNRRADNWLVALAIADLAGGDWGDLTRAAVVSSEKITDSRTANVRLLSAIQTVFAGVEDDAISSADLIEKLTGDPDSEWFEWSRGKPISQKQLANMLKPFGVIPDLIRVGGRPVRGYHRWQFEDAWGRYL